MAQAQGTNGGVAVADPPDFPHAKELQYDVVKQIALFEAKKLTQLKSDIDAFLKKADGLVDDYTKKYPVLLDRWCGQHQQIVQLASALQCAFPGQKWEDIVSDCICKNNFALYC